MIQLINFLLHLCITNDSIMDHISYLGSCMSAHLHQTSRNKTILETKHSILGYIICYFTSHVYLDDRESHSKVSTHIVVVFFFFFFGTYSNIQGNICLTYNNTYLKPTDKSILPKYLASEAI